MKARLTRTERQTNDFKHAAALLKDDLIWSGDFESIRPELFELIDHYSKSDPGYAPVQIRRIVQKLISFDNDLSI